MTYQELLLHPKWRERRYEIICRDKHKCLKCNNVKILEDALIGVIIKSGLYHSGTMYRFQGFNELRGQKVLMTKESTVNDNGYIAYADREAISSKFGKIIAVRKRVSELPTASVNGSFFNALLTMEVALPLNSFKWVYVQGLHVHHSYYQKGRTPWDYPDEALQTLCWVCHESLHSQITVPYLDEQGNEIGRLTPCGKCAGAGYLPEYKHVQEGICFSCQGARYIELVNRN